MKLGRCHGCGVRTVLWLVPLTGKRQWWCVACRPKAEQVLEERDAA